MKVRIASLFVPLLAAGALVAQAAPLSEILKKTPAGTNAAPVAGGTVSTGAVGAAAVVAGGIAAAAGNDDTTSTTGTTGTVAQ